MKRLWQAVLVLISAAYPLLWYFGREYNALRPLAAVMTALWLLRLLFADTRGQRLLAAAAAGFFALVWLFRQPEAMYWYPVAVNLLMLMLFGGSLFARQSLIERLARLQQPDLPPEGVHYTRRVTQIWCAFFIFNGSIAAALVCLQAYRAWAVYTGIVSYVLMGTLMGGEWLYRRFVLRLPENRSKSAFLK